MNYHQLGGVAEAGGDFESAEQWYLRALAYYQETVNECETAIICRQLGNVAREREDLEGAQKWYEKSLANEGDEQGAALSCYQLGEVAHERGDSEGALTWFERAKAIYEKLGN